MYWVIRDAHCISLLCVFFEPIFYDGIGGCDGYTFAGPRTAPLHVFSMPIGSVQLSEGGYVNEI